jgi:hypothetical protein
VEVDVHDGASRAPPTDSAHPSFPLTPSVPAPPPPPCAQGTLRRKGDAYDIKWDAPAEIVTSHNEAGRGCELSELVRYNDRLYTFDDRTGIMFEVEHSDRSDALPAPYLVPRHIFMEGGGDINDKGLKIEWSTVKDGLLYVGSFGKEFTNSKGEIVHTNNLWVVTYDKNGVATHHDWQGNYDRLRGALGYDYPGYLLHETIVWSPHNRKWFVLPRRMSKEVYEEKLDEKKGANTIIMASHDFTDITWKTVGVSGGGRTGPDTSTSLPHCPLLLPPLLPPPLRRSRPRSAASRPPSSSPAAATPSSSRSRARRTPSSASSAPFSPSTGRRPRAAGSGPSSSRRPSCPSSPSSRASRSSRRTRGLGGFGPRRRGQVGRRRKRTAVAACRGTRCAEGRRRRACFIGL